MVCNTEERIFADQQRLMLPAVANDDVATVDRHGHAYVHLLPGVRVSEFVIAEELHMTVRQQIVHGVGRVVKIALGRMGQREGGKTGAAKVDLEKRIAANERHYGVAVKCYAIGFLRNKRAHLVGGHVNLQHASI